MDATTDVKNVLGLKRHHSSLITHHYTGRGIQVEVLKCGIFHLAYYFYPIHQAGGGIPGDGYESLLISA